MVRSIRGILALCVVVVMIMGVADVVCAQDMSKKLGRGVANILTGWIELPKNIYDTSVEENAFSGITMGLARGVGMTVVRTGAGVYEAVTFPFPLPEGYEPIVEPEYLLNSE